MTKPDFSNVQDPELRAKLEKVATEHQDTNQEIKTNPIDIDYVHEGITKVPGTDEKMTYVVNRFGGRLGVGVVRELADESILCRLPGGELVLAWPMDKAWQSNVVSDGQEKGENA